jgi:hypothetical protein
MKLGTRPDIVPKTKIFDLQLARVVAVVVAVVAVVVSVMTAASF